jgi:hypothetical protein
MIDARICYSIEESEGLYRHHGHDYRSVSHPMFVDDTINAVDGRSAGTLSVVRGSAF